MKAARGHFQLSSKPIKQTERRAPEIVFGEWLRILEDAKRKDVSVRIQLLGNKTPQPTEDDRRQCAETIASLESSLGGNLLAINLVAALGFNPLEYRIVDREKFILGCVVRMLMGIPIRLEITPLS